MNRTSHSLLKCVRYFGCASRRKTERSLLLTPANISLKLYPKANIHTTTFYNEKKEIGEDPETVVTIKNPFKYVAQALKVLTKMRKIDIEFDEYEFLEGTNQAIVYVSDKLADGNFKDMKHLLTPNGMNCLKNIYETNPQSSILRVEDSDIIVIVPASVTVEEDDSDRKWVYVLVDCCCEGPRIISWSFCREYTDDDSNSSWVIDAVNYRK